MQKLLTTIFILAVTASSVSGQAFKPRYKSSSQGSTSRTQTSNRSLELRVLVSSQAAVGTRHEWMQALAEVGADRVVAETSRVDRPSFEEFDSGSSKLLTVVGIVKRGKLYLPGGSFSIGQIAGIRSHIKKLRDDGAEVTVADKVAFGLTAKQLISVHDQLGGKVGFTTKGRDVGELTMSLLKKSGYKISIDEETKLTIAVAESKMEYELESFSMGTALSLSLRQMGLAFEPKRPQGQKIQLLIRELDDKTKNWPVGWPISESLKKVAPKLYVKVSVEALDTPILDLLGAIEGRIEIPFVYDRAKISAKGIDLKATKVKFSRPGKKSSYDMVIDKVLNQCKPKMKSELKIDEVGKQFLWITPRN